MKRLKREHIDGIIKGALPGVLGRAAGTADLVRLVEFEQKLVPRKVTPRRVSWSDFLD